MLLIFISFVEKVSTEDIGHKFFNLTSWRNIWDNSKNTSDGRMAKLGKVPGSGSGDREFKSRSDHHIFHYWSIGTHFLYLPLVYVSKPG